MSAFTIIAIILALMIGATVGALAVSMCVAAREADADDEDMRQVLRRQR
jgi:type II secretory pathway component PulJ